VRGLELAKPLLLLLSQSETKKESRKLEKCFLPSTVVTPAMTGHCQPKGNLRGKRIRKSVNTQQLSGKKKALVTYTHFLKSIDASAVRCPWSTAGLENKSLGYFY